MIAGYEEKTPAGAQYVDKQSGLCEGFMILSPNGFSFLCLTPCLLEGDAQKKRIAKEN